VFSRGKIYIYRYLKAITFADEEPAVPLREYCKRKGLE